jgi:hypothetical protein
MRRSKMDDTIKILIGTLSGFLIAFLSEPIKLYFQNQINKNNLRKALYHEIFSNYYAFGAFVEHNDNGKKVPTVDIDVLQSASRHNIRTEYYKFATTQNAHLFYQLKEASWINLLYGLLSALIEWAEIKDNNKVKKPEALINSFMENVEDCLKGDIFSKKIMSQVLGKQLYDVIIEKLEN